LQAGVFNGLDPFHGPGAIRRAEKVDRGIGKDIRDLLLSQGDGCHGRMEKQDGKPEGSFHGFERISSRADDRPGKRAWTGVLRSIEDEAVFYPQLVRAQGFVAAPWRAIFPTGACFA
jgi:hypothetical protein